MSALSTRTRVAALAGIIVIVALVVLSFFVLRPVVQARRSLRLLAATQVGQTRVEDFRKMATDYGVPVSEHPDAFDLSQQNSVLRHLHLAPPTIIEMNARTSGGVVIGVHVLAFVGKELEFAKIQINEFDTRNTGCEGGPPVCVKSTTSTMWTTVFFIPSTPPDQRARLLSINAWCLAKIGGCQSSREVFPVASEY